ncbi:dienelactone hydrolase family protein [Nocardioides sp. cx-173]|uniref:dienelactone hydrolase family protein n=1 Tax=Nocardioides sp. cx-173 TaxID=2898796 RepID=UPI001E3AEDB4|nr:dienelactone hydrolase family protein [Nocardioides sp. cx-173]MCD4524305.1 dienelactone hydrolase family protein [Nocardioides sp. cx-173]UGB41696.1 dienelactone hydrolase family protein [Nocardioides sp. cx-173]
MDLLDLPAADGTAEAYLARPASGSGPGVLLFMDAIGLRPQIQEMCDRIAGWGYVVLAPNVFYREGSVAELAPRVDLRAPGGREEFFAEAMPRVHRLTPDLAVPDIAAYVQALRDLPGVTEGPIGVTGYCMGARLAVRAATSHPALVTACAGFHGAGLVTDEPDSPHLGLSAARAEFVFGHAHEDASMPPEAVDALGRALLEHGLIAANEVYPAPHGYTMADTSAYDEAAAERHFTELQALLARALPA